MDRGATSSSCTATTTGWLCEATSAPGRTLTRVILHAASRPADDTIAEPHRFDVEAATYEDALAQARASVPDGWVLLYVTRAED